jgi:hypothetical protein
VKALKKIRHPSFRLAMPARIIPYFMIARLLNVPELLGIRPFAGMAAAEMTGRAFFEELFKPGFVLDFLVEYRQGKVVGTMVFTVGVIADIMVYAYCTTLRLEKNLKDGFGIGGFLRQISGGAGGVIVKLPQISVKLPAQFVYPWYNRFEVQAVFESGIFSALFNGLAIRPDKVGPEQRIVVIGGKLSGGGLLELFDEQFDVYPCFFNQFSIYFRHRHTS